MTVTKEMLQRMIQEFECVEITEKELDGLLPHVQEYTKLIGKLRQVDLSQVVSARLLRAKEGE